MNEYAVVVATRNRAEMLAHTLPLFATQTRPPAQIIVIDRSDDHEEIRALCAVVAARTGHAVEVEYGNEANLPAQRNQGLARVRTEVTILPDDDSVWFPDTAARFLEVYDADPDRRYGAVTGVDVYAGPDDLAAVPRRRMRFTEHPAVMSVRNAVERAVVPQPFEDYGRARTRALAPAARAAGLAHRLVGTVGGYRMSFRTELVRGLGFDPVLGSRVGYGIHEDKDMALRVLRAGGLIAVAEDARVFHNVHPGRRARGVDYGFFHVLNYAYVCRKLHPTRTEAVRRLDRYLRYKVLLYGMRRTDAYERDIHRGAVAALTRVPGFWDVSDDALAETYRRLSVRPDAEEAT